MSTFHVLATWSGNGLTTTHHSESQVPRGDVLTTVDELLRADAYIVEIRKIQTRRQAEKASV